MRNPLENIDVFRRFSTVLFVHIQMARDTADHDRPDIPLDERLDIGAELVGDIGAFLVDPLARNEALLIRDLVDILDRGMALIWVVRLTLKDDHHTRVALVGRLDRGAADLSGLDDIDPGSQMRGRSLQRTQFDRAGLTAEFACQILAEEGRRTGQLFVSNGETYGMNALLVYAIAILESGNGTSDFSRNRNNLFGIAAYDTNPNAAYSFPSVEQCIKEEMGI